MKIVPAIPIKNQYKKIAIRFSYENRSAIPGSKSICEFFFKPDPDFEMKTTITNAVEKGHSESPQAFQVRLQKKRAFS
jgi:hypothetical protein